MYVYHIFMHSSDDGHLGSFLVLVLPSLIFLFFFFFLLFLLMSYGPIPSNLSVKSQFLWYYSELVL